MTVNSARMGWPYPSRDDDPWYDAFEDFVQAVDASGFAHREDRSIIWSGGGTLSWDLGTETLEWTGTISVYSPLSSRLIQIAADSLVDIIDGEVIYTTLTRQPLSNQTATLTKGNQVPSNDNAMALAVRIGDVIFFRTGFSLGDGDTSAGVAPLPGGGGSDPNAIHDNIAGEIDAITEKVSPTTSDILLIEDKADSENKKKVEIGNLPVVDANAIHDNVSGEIAAITDKASPVSTDRVIIEDSAAGNAKKSVQLGNIIATDPDAIHDNVANEISAITAKGSPVGADLLIIEDSADSNNKKRVLISNLPGSDLRGPAIVVGNSVAGDTSDVCDYLDIGDGAQLNAALTAAAGASPVKDVWIRPGTYDLSQGGSPAGPLSVDGVMCRGAGRESVTIQTKTVGDVRAFLIEDGGELEDVSILVPKATSDYTGSAAGIVTLDSTTGLPSPRCRRVSVMFDDYLNWTTLEIGRITSHIVAAFVMETGARQALVEDCLAFCTETEWDGSSPVPPLNQLSGFLSKADAFGFGPRFENCISYGGDFGFVGTASGVDQGGRFHGCESIEPAWYGFLAEGTSILRIDECLVLLASVGATLGFNVGSTGMAVLLQSNRNNVSDSEFKITSTNGTPAGVFAIDIEQDDNVVTSNKCIGFDTTAINLQAASTKNIVTGNRTFGEVIVDAGTAGTNEVAHNVI